MERGEFKKYLTEAELEEYDTLIATPEVKAAQAELRKKYKAKMTLYNLRSLYKRGKELLDNQNQ